MRRTIQDLTDVFLRTGKSKYGDNVEGTIRYKRCEINPLECKADANGRFFIEGYASTEALDSYNEIVLSDAFKSTIEEFKRDSILLFMHDWWGIPIGFVPEVEIHDGVGLWVRAEIIGEREEVRDIKRYIERGILKYFSIGFSIKKAEYDDDEKINRIQDLMLFEISVVNKGANPLALFSQSKSLKQYYQSVNQPEDEPVGKGLEMAPNILEIEPRLKKIENFLGAAEGGFDDVVAKAVTASMANVNEMLSNQQRALKALQEKADALGKGLITADEFKLFSDKTGADILNLSQELKKLHDGKEVLKARYSVRDWRSLEGMDIIRDDNNIPLSPINQKAWRIFNTPVDYEGEGRVLKLCRDLLDVSLLTWVYLRRRGVSLNRLKSYQLLHNLMEGYDPEFAKAMYSTGAGLGDEWVPTMMSASMEEYYRLQPALEKYFQVVDMPNQPYQYPIKAGGGICYLADEATSDSADEFLKTTFATANITFTAKKFAGASIVSVELTEDSIVPIIPEIRNELTISLLEGFEDVLVNGDTTATHMDSDVTSAKDRRKAFKGLRRQAKDSSKEFDVQSTSAGVGDATSAFVAKDVRYLRKLQAEMGIYPDQVKLYTGMNGWYSLISIPEVLKANEFGAPSTWLTGKLPILDGAEIYVSAKVRADLAATGVYTGSGALTHVGAFNSRGFRIGSRRGITVDYQKLIFTDQLAFVATMRKDFQKFAAASRYPVSNGYNVV